MAAISMRDFLDLAAFCAPWRDECGLLMSCTFAISESRSETVETLEIAVCVFTDAQLLDYGGPLDLFGFLVKENLPKYNMPMPPKLLKLVYVGPTKSPIQPTSGPPILPHETYDEALASGKKYDVVFVPGEVVPPSLVKFVAAQFHCTKYFLSVCTGAWVVAQAGVLEGRRATTNKAVFRTVKASTSKDIDWVTHARWVVDGTYWSSSGVSAGLDMAAAWLEHIVGHDVAQRILAGAEYTPAQQDDDPWAKYYGLE
ncbi:class I glutamine amidotransferase-like protein [Auriculariales sp. MPI-PUGE-AT-0066]|nr:class I glutamine amidotransferase-like protein [Auriculariales sp. MPI-PUGE-AT-0066]